MPAVPLLLGSIVILLVTFVVYFPSLQGGFIWDDDVTLTNNPLIVAPGGLYDIWFSTKAYDYWPLTYTSLWLEWHLWGTETLGYRVTNLLLHIAGAIVLWRVLLRLAVPGAWVAALIFAVHPVCVASTAWISERKNVLSLVFYLLSILWYLRAEEQRHNPTTSAKTSETGAGKSQLGLSASHFYWLSLGTFLLALLSKTSVVMLPFVLLLCIWWVRMNHESAARGPATSPVVSSALTLRDLARTLPFFVLALILGLVTVWFQHHRAIGGGEPSGPLLERLIAGSWALWFYLSKAILPMNLSVLYERWDVNPREITAYLPLLGWLGLLMICWKFRKGWSRPFLFAFAYFTISLLPVLGVFDMSYLNLSRAADHWQYVAIIGPMTLAVGGLAGLLRQSRRVSLPTRTVLASGIIAILALVSSERGKLYADPELLWRDALKKDPRSKTAYNDLGVALVNKGRLDEALPLLQKAVEYNAKSPTPYNNLGMAMFEKGRVDEAIEWYRQSLQLNPGYSAARFNIAVALARKEQWSEAAEHYSAAIEIRPDNAQAHNNLGNILGRLGQTNEAKFHYEQAVHFRRGFAEAHNNLGNALRAEGKIEEAVKHYQTAVKSRPAYPNARIRLGEYAMMQGRPAEAVEHFDFALMEDPGSAEAHTGKAMALAALEENDAAIEHLEKAIKANPAFSRAYYHLGNALLSRGRTNEVVERFSAALESHPDVAEAHYFIGVVMRLQGKMPEAMSRWRKAVELKPNWVEALNNLAWHLATQQDVSLRNGAEAIELARRAADLTRSNDPDILDTLAAAYAETGKFAEAAETLRNAIAAAQSRRQTNSVSEMEERLSRYVASSEKIK